MAPMVPTAMASTMTVGKRLWVPVPKRWTNHAATRAMLR